MSVEAIETTVVAIPSLPGSIPHDGAGHETLEEIVAAYGSAVTAVAACLYGPALGAGVAQSAFVELGRQSDALQRRDGELRVLLLGSVHRASPRTAFAHPLLSGLPARESRAIALVAYGGCTYREAAEVLDQPEDQVLTAVRSGLQRLHADPADVQAVG